MAPRRTGPARVAAPHSPEGADERGELRLADSIGYQTRSAHRAFQRYLRSQIEPHGVTLGMWYFLRALWQEDGLTQRELSVRIGTMEPTTLTAIAGMERIGLVKRSRNKFDRRKLNVKLTAKGHELKATLLPLAADVVDTATAGFSDHDKERFLDYLAAVQRNLALAAETNELEQND